MSSSKRITIKEAMYRTGYTERNIYYIIKKEPELLGYNPSDKTCSKDKVRTIADVINNRYTIADVAFLLNLPQQSAQRYARILDLGIMIRGHRYCTQDDVNTIRDHMSKRKHK